VLAHGTVEHHIAPAARAELAYGFVDQLAVVAIKQDLDLVQGLVRRDGQPWLLASWHRCEPFDRDGIGHGYVRQRKREEQSDRKNRSSSQSGRVHGAKSITKQKTALQNPSRRLIVS
jgi:hypothetical protein